MPEAAPKPVLVFDGDCGFCRRWVGRWRALTGDVIEYRAYQVAAADFPQVPREQFGQAVHLFEPDGTVRRGAEAVFRSLALAGRKRWAWWAYRFVPGVRAVTEAGYHFVAGHRDPLDKIDRLLLGESPVAYRLTRRVFMAGLGIIYLIAFLSLFVQIDGLVGSQGILPAADYMREVREYAAARGLGAGGFLLAPGVCWWGAGDGVLHGLCIAGMVAAALMAFGVLEAEAAIVCWICYSSLVTVGQVFLGFQWDGLLLEAGFLAIFIGSWRPWGSARKARPVSGVMVFLVRWLVFRLMFLSGVVKLASHDPAWRTWTAMQYHYETQPLPAWTSWYMAHLPIWFQKLSVGVMFVAELIVPILVFGPRRVRLFAFWVIVIFQLLIAAAGNFGFFNWLAIVLCLFLLDDAVLTRGRLLIEEVTRPCRIGVRWDSWVKGAVAALILAVSVGTVAHAFGEDWELPGVFGRVGSWAEELRLVSPYGLFAVMTTERPEVIVEGSRDGDRWTEYEFKWKAGDVRRRPSFCEPHMPRLDWQMWFAALGDASESPWFGGLARGLLEGRPAVTALLANDPFAGQPPKYVRARLYLYHFTTAVERKETGAWWRRELMGDWFPVVALPTTTPTVESGAEPQMRTEAR